MITISSVVHQKLISNPFILDGLRQDIINISELARYWHHDIEFATKKTISIDALAMSIRRAASTVLHAQQDYAQLTISPLQCTMRSDLIERSYVKSATIMRSFKRLTDTLDLNADTFITLSTGVQEVTIVADRKLENFIVAACKEEKETTSLDDLSCIILKLPDIVINTPGSYYTFLGKLTWSGINIEEVVSTAHELILVVKTTVAHEAFKCLTTS